LKSQIAAAEAALTEATAGGGDSSSSGEGANSGEGAKAGESSKKQIAELRKEIASIECPFGLQYSRDVLVEFQFHCTFLL